MMKNLEAAFVFSFPVHRSVKTGMLPILPPLPPLPTTRLSFLPKPPAMSGSGPLGCKLSGTCQ